MGAAQPAPRGTEVSQVAWRTTSARQPRIGLDAAANLARHDVSAVGFDNAAVERAPFDEGRLLSMHVELLVRRGIPLIEHRVLTQMAQDSYHQALLVAAPLLGTGAGGSPLNPVTIGLTITSASGRPR